MYPIFRPNYQHHGCPDSSRIPARTFDLPAELKPSPADMMSPSKDAINQQIKSMDPAPKQDLRDELLSEMCILDLQMIFPLLSMYVRNVGVFWPSPMSRFGVADEISSSEMYVSTNLGPPSPCFYKHQFSLTMKKAIP